MTTAIGTLGNQGSASVAREMREKGAPAAPTQRTSGAEGSEFAAMLLLAGTLGASPRVSPGASGTRGISDQAAGGGKAHGDAGVKAAGRGGATATSIAGRTLAQSQADELRTVGKGVNLKALAQAEMRGEGGGAAAESGSLAKGNADASKMESKEGVGMSAKGGAEQGEPSKAVTPNAGEVVEPVKATSASRAASAAAPGTVAALASLERVSRASVRAAGEVSRGVSGVGSTATLTVRAVGTLAKAGLDALRSSGGGAGVSGGQSGGQATGPSNGHPGGIAGAAGFGGSGGGLKTGPALSAGRSPSGVAGEASPPKFAPQVHRALGQALTSRDGTVTIHLTPEHLGRLRVEVSRGEGGVRATFEAESSEARGLLERALPELKAAMESRGMHVETLDVRQARGLEPSDAERAGGDGGTGQGGGGDTPSDTPARSRDGDPAPGGEGDEPGGGGRRRHGGRGASESSGMEPAAMVHEGGFPAEPGVSLSTIEVVV